jgi:hypothetical protein
MPKQKHLAALLAGASAAALCAAAHAENFNVPGGSLKAALDAYAAQAGVQLVVSADAVKGVKPSPTFSPKPALTRITAHPARW